MFQGGLNKLPKDKRDLKVGAVFGPAKEIPTVSFIVAEPLNVKNQGRSFRCAGYAGATVAEIQEGVPLSGDFLYGLAKGLDGDMKDGTNLRTVCKVLTKIGAVEEGEWRETLTEQEIKEWWNWKDKYIDFAIKHRKKAYFSIETSGDFFDNVRAALWEHRDKKCFALTGTHWYSGWFVKFLNAVIGTSIGGHAVAVIGQEIVEGIPYLVIQNSVGKTIGDNGRHLVSREIFNSHFKDYGAFQLIDMEEAEVRRLIENLAQQKTLMGQVIDLLKQLVGLLAKKKL